MTEIDVSGCEYYQIEANELYPKAQYCGSMRNTFCENEPNCYYKQLKRLEQENAKLKEALEEIKRTAEEQIKRYPDSFKFKDSEYNTIIEICDEVLKDE